MIRQYQTLWLIVLALFLNRVTTWLPEYVYFDPFPFHDILDSEGKEIGITLQSYWNAIIIHIAWIILWIREVLKKNEFSGLFLRFIGIEILSTLDYLIRYEQAFYDIPLAGGQFYHLEFTDFKILLYVICIGRWRRKIFS